MCPGGIQSFGSQVKSSVLTTQPKQQPGGQTARAHYQSDRTTHTVTHSVINQANGLRIYAPSLLNRALLRRSVMVRGRKSVWARHRTVTKSQGSSSLLPVKQECVRLGTPFAKNGEKQKLHIQNEMLLFFLL